MRLRLGPILETLVWSRFWSWRLVMIGGRNTVIFVETLIRWVRCSFGNVLSIHVVVRSKTAPNSNWPFCFAEWVGIPKKSWPGLTNISWLQFGVQSVLSCLLDTIGHCWTLVDQAYIGTSSVHQSCRTLAIVSPPGKCHNTNLSQSLQVVTIRNLDNNAKQSWITRHFFNVRLQLWSLVDRKLRKLEFCCFAFQHHRLRRLRPVLMKPSSWDRQEVSQWI